jgi:DNA-binding MarR family transcriptional regulator
LRAPDTVPRALGHLRVALDDAYLKTSRQLGLTAPQAELLCASLRPAAVGRLAELLRCDRTNVTHLVDRAVERGWVERRVDETDARLSLIGLTPEGERLARQLIKKLEAQLGPLLASWSGERKQRAVELLGELADELDRAGAASPQPAKQG